MSERLRLTENLDCFQTVVLLYCDKNENVHLGCASYYGGKNNDRRYLNLLYKDALPDKAELIGSWNYLDDNSSKIYPDYTKDMELAVDDFLYAHNTAKNHSDLEYEVVDSYSDMDKYFNNTNIKPGQVIAYGMLKSN